MYCFSIKLSILCVCDGLQADLLKKLMLFMGPYCFATQHLVQVDQNGKCLIGDPVTSLISL